MLAEPSKATPLIVLAFARTVAVEAFPVNAPVTLPVRLPVNVVDATDESPASDVAVLPSESTVDPIVTDELVNFPFGIDPASLL